MTTEKPKRPNYGIDAPTVVRNFIVIAAAAILGGIVLSQIPKAHEFGRPFVIMGGWLTISAIGMIWSSLYGKMRARDRLLNTIPWRGDEQVLDVGCGHGLMLIGAAKRLTTGRAIGIDIWQNVDQASNSADATRQNAEIEGVGDRVEIRDGDARAIPLPDASVDVVVSSFAIHNIYNSAEREKALSEIIRVLRPGGHVAILDIRHGIAYSRYFREQGLTLVRNRIIFLFVVSWSIVARRLQA